MLEIGKMTSLKDHLLNTCNSMYKTALTNCKSDFVDRDSCFWYHSIWQYLRVLDCVSSPDWHKDFYIQAIKKYINKNNINQINILISGCADNSMLYVVVLALSQMIVEQSKLTGKIVAVDLCDTPLIVCRNWWANAKKCGEYYDFDRVFQNFEFLTVAKDIFTYSNEHFNLIITDAFLTRFPKDTVLSLLQHWKTLLYTSGQIITTVRLHTEPSVSLNERCSQIVDFVKKVTERYTDYQDQFSMSRAQIKYKAYTYAVKMDSHSLGNADEIMNMFKQCFKIVHYNDNKTQGELTPAVYGQYVLEKEYEG